MQKNLDISTLVCALPSCYFWNKKKSYSGFHPSISVPEPDAFDTKIAVFPPFQMPCSLMPSTPDRKKASQSNPTSKVMTARPAINSETERQTPEASQRQELLRPQKLLKDYFCGYAARQVCTEPYSQPASRRYAMRLHTSSL